MKTITFNSNYSAFAYRMTAEIGDDVNEATVLLCLEGVANICYRTAGSNVDKALGVKSKKNGGMGRDGISYDERLRDVIDKAVSAKITELEASTPAIKAWKLSFAVTGEYVKGESASSKEADALWVQVQALPTDKFITAMTKLGFKGEFTKDAQGQVVSSEFDYDDAAGIAACQRHIQAEKKAAQERAKSALGI